MIIREVERTGKEAVVAQSRYEERSYLRITGTLTWTRTWCLPHICCRCTMVLGEETGCERTNVFLLGLLEP
jgi:hypothetical protein